MRPSSKHQSNSLRKSQRLGMIKAQSGFTIIEILVAFFISLIGLQGLIAIQTLSLGNAQGSYYRAQGITLLNDIVGRMNANPRGVSEGDYDGFDSSGTVPSIPGCISSTGGCSTAQLAARDLNSWAANFTNVNSLSNYASTLPNSTGTIALQSDGSYLITVTWDETRWNTELANGADQEVVQASVSRNINVLIPF